MTEAPKYEVWIADLNSRYAPEPRPPVFAEDCFTLEEAFKARDEYQSPDTAAWVQDKETGAIIGIDGHYTGDRRLSR